MNVRLIVCDIDNTLVEKHQPLTPRAKKAIEDLKAKGITFYAAHLKGERFYDEFDYTKEGGCAFLIGNEGNGLKDETADLADTYLKIPMEGKLESLNAAVASSILMYEVYRQKRINK